ncbi:MAG: hypothetical protein QOG04_595 [Actinomycetota bacterium]|nr:hypothetical protein [Actinomycetota bacterium]
MTQIGRPTIVVCDVGALQDPDALTLDMLGRVQLIARRFGCEVRFRHACEELQELIEFAGLSEVLALESRGQTEEGEQVGGIEEERDPDDLPP